MRPREGEGDRAGFRQSFPRVLHHPALAFYWNIKGEVDPQRRIVKPVTLITKALKWVEDEEEEQEEVENWGGGGGVDGESEGGKGPEATTEEVNCVCRWLRGSSRESHSTTSNHNSWATAERSWRAGQVEGNCIDIGTRWRMLGSHVLREAEKPSGDVKTLADSTEVRPLTFPFLYFIFAAVWWACVPSCWAWFGGEGKCDWQHLQ